MLCMLSPKSEINFALVIFIQCLNQQLQQPEMDSTVTNLAPFEIFSLNFQLIFPSIAQGSRYRDR